MKKNVFIAYIEEIDNHFIGFLCEDIENNNIFAEDPFGNFCTIENGKVIANMLEYEPEEYKIADSLNNFYNKYPLYDIEEVFKLLDEVNSNNSSNCKNEKIEKEHDFITELYKAKAIIGKDFIDLSFVVDKDQYNVSAAYNYGKISKEELSKLEIFYPKYLKEANKVNNDKKEAQKLL